MGRERTTNDNKFMVISISTFSDRGDGLVVEILPSLSVKLKDKSHESFNVVFRENLFKLTHLVYVLS